MNSGLGETCSGRVSQVQIISLLKRKAGEFITQCCKILADRLLTVITGYQVLLASLLGKSAFDQPKAFQA